MNTPIFSVFWTTLRTLFFTEPWFQWVLPVVVAIAFLFWIFVVVNRTSESKKWKVFFTFTFLLAVMLLLNIPNFYENMRAGSPDKRCPELTINKFTKQIEPVKYDYMAHHVVPGPSDTGFIDLFVKQYEIFGVNSDVQNSHVCRLPYDEGAKKLLQNLRNAKQQQLGAAKKAGVSGENASKFGNIRITLPGSAESRAKMDSSIEKDEKREGKKDRDDSFGHAEFKAPDMKTQPKLENSR